jgi:hypothetical protein
MYTQKNRTTLADWQAVAIENRVARDLARAALWAEQVCDGSRPVAYICGVAGVGKTHAIRQGLHIAKARGLAPIYCNPTSYREMVDAYAEAGGKRPVVFEEADQVFGTERMLNILKIATDEAGPRVYSEDGKRPVKLDAPTLVASNRDLNDDALFEPKLRPHIQALRSRSAPLVITADPHLLWEYACHLAITKGLIRQNNRGQGISLRIQDAALAWFTEHLWRLDEVSPRRLREIARGIDRYWDREHGNWKRGGEEAWRADLQAFLTRPTQDTQVPTTPHMVLPERQREAA